MSANTVLDIRIAFNNYGQDLAEVLNNESIVTLDGGITRTVLPSDAIDWKWSTWMPEKVVVSTSFDLNIAEAAPLLKNGEFLLMLEGTTKPGGLIFAHTIPSYLFHNLVTGDWPQYMPYPGSLSATTFREQEYLQSWAAPHRPQQHLVGGKVGDLDKNGVVNVADLLLLTGKFGT